MPYVCKKNNPLPLQERLAVSPAEAAQLLGSNRHTVDALVKSGDLTAFRVGRRVCIRVDRIIEFIELMEQSATK